MVDPADGVPARLADRVPSDPPVVDRAGRPFAPGVDGAVVERLTPLVDHRGTLTEVIDFDLPFWSEPVVTSRGREAVVGTGTCVIVPPSLHCTPLRKAPFGTHVSTTAAKTP